MLSAVAIALFSSAAFAPPAGISSAAATRASVAMNAANNANVKENIKNGNNGLYGWQVKKNSKTGDTANLRGYTVGSRAPPMAVKSGTTIAEAGFKYKGVGRLGKGLGASRYTVPGTSGDTGLDLRNFDGSAKKSYFVHRTVMMSGGEDKDCFINRAKAGPIAAVNDIFIHEGDSLSAKNKDCFLERGI